MICLQYRQLDEERMAEKDDRPSESFAGYTLRNLQAKAQNEEMKMKKLNNMKFSENLISENLIEDEDNYSIEVMMMGMDGGKNVDKMHERRFGLFKRIHAIAVYGDSPTTLFDW